MTDLVDFLRARLDEDERTAQATMWEGSGNKASWDPVFSATLDVGTEAINVGDRTINDHMARHDPARVLREVEAGREIVNYESNGHLRGLHIDAWGIWRDQLKSLAAVYADHPDYLQEWALTPA